MPKLFPFLPILFLLCTFLFVLTCPPPLVTVQYLDLFAIIVAAVVCVTACLCLSGRETRECSLYPLGLLIGKA